MKTFGYKEEKKEMKKRIVLTLVAAVAAISLMGCGITTTKTYTETTTDADGNTTTTTTTTTNGETTTETTESAAPAEEEEEVVKTVATIAFDNQTDFDFVEMYFSSGADENWGDNILGDTPLEVGGVVTFDEGFTYSSNNTVWDIKVVSAEGASVEFNGADMTASSDPEYIYLTFTGDAESQSYSAEFQ